MPSTLKYKKIYIDSKFRSSGSESSSNFKYELPETIAFHENTCAYLDDICIPHSLDTILQNINDKLYFKVYKINVLPELEYNIIATIPHGHYIPPDLIAEIQDEMNSYAQTATTVANLFTCSYVIKTNSMQIVCNSPFYAFRIVSKPELKTIEWSGPSFDRNNPNDINDIISNLNELSHRYNSVIPYLSGSLFMQPFSNIYIHATNFGNYNSIGPMNERTIVKKVPVTADYNHMIFDQCVLINDYQDVSSSTIKTLYFSLRSSKGHIIPLNGCNWSFSIIFCRSNPDL